MYGKQGLWSRLESLKEVSCLQRRFPLAGAGEEDIFSNENFLYKRETDILWFRAFPKSAVSHLPSAQNNPYAKVACFGGGVGGAEGQWR